MVVEGINPYFVYFENVTYISCCSIQKLGQNSGMDIATTSSGSLTLDLALGSGYPKGRVVEIYGPESSGKTTLALHAVAEVQKTGGNKS